MVNRDVNALPRESWLKVFEELSEQEELETLQHIKGINNQIDAGLLPGESLNFSAIEGLSRAELCSAHEILLLEATVPGSSDSSDAIDSFGSYDSLDSYDIPDRFTNIAMSAPLQISETDIQSFRRIWEAPSSSKPCIFAVIDPSASANGYFEQLKVSDGARLRAELQKCKTTWGDGRVVYIGVLLFGDVEPSAIVKLLEAAKPPMEPVLSLIINLDCGLAQHHQMAFPLFMQNKDKPEVSASQADQLRRIVKQL